MICAREKSNRSPRLTATRKSTAIIPRPLATASPDQVVATALMSTPARLQHSAVPTSSRTEREWAADMGKGVGLRTGAQRCNAKGAERWAGRPGSGENEFAARARVHIVGCMQRRVFVIGAGFVLAGGAVFFWPAAKKEKDGGAVAPVAAKMTSDRAASAAKIRTADQVVVATASPARLTIAEKAARVEKIRADYDAIRKGVADELAAVAAASAAGPGPFGDTRVFLRRLALLEREQRADLAQVLDVQELEDFELRESSTGRLVAARLGATAATDAQRRAVFRFRREFDERFGFAFDFSREALGERERARQRMDEQIRAVLGEALFAAWVAGDVR